MQQKIGILIATSLGRAQLLYERALASVFNQTVNPDYLLVVDDNDDDGLFFVLNDYLKDRQFPCCCIRNKRIKHMSGTGAWNTGIDYLSKALGEDAYVCILDDDDTWSPDYIMKVKEQILKESEPLDAIFPYINREDCPSPLKFDERELVIENFLIGNPGIQGSNMVFRLSCLNEIDGFDENMSSCTDRDLLIRFLEKFGIERIRIIPEVLSFYHVTKNSVTYDLQKKSEGLNYFFKKHIGRFTSYDLLDQSLKRAERLFNYPHRNMIESLFLSKI